MSQVVKNFPFNSGGGRVITFSNGHSFENMVPSGTLYFDGQGWWWEKPLVWAGLIRPELFTVVIRTLTRQPRFYPDSSLSWIRPWTWLPWSPWSCVRFLPDGGVANKVRLYNPGIEWWCREVGPKLDYERFPLVGSILGDKQQMVEMADMFNAFDFVAVEVNSFCPNKVNPLATAHTVIDDVRAVSAVSRHPIILKTSCDQPYMEIVRGLKGYVQAVSLNSVKIETVYPDGKIRPLAKLEKKYGGGGGGVSGRPAQPFNWKAVTDIADQGLVPVIGPDIMEYEDIARVRERGASAWSFGAIHLKTPWKATSIVKQEMKRNENARRYGNRPPTLRPPPASA